MLCGHSWRTPAVKDDERLEDRYELAKGIVRFGTYTANHEGRLPHHLSSRLDLVEQGQGLVDFGAGDGTFLACALERGIDAWGVDRKTPGVGNDLLKNFIRENLEEFPARRFDFAHANHVLEHVDNPVAILSDLRSRLKSRGKILVEVPNELDSLSTEAKMLLGKKSTSATSLYEHQHYFTVRSLTHALEVAGFRMLDVCTPRRIFRGARGWIDGVASRVHKGEVIYAVAVCANLS